MHFKDSIISSLFELNQLGKNEYYAIDKLKWWLMKYKDLNKELEMLCNSEAYCDILEDGSFLRKAFDDESNQNYTFRDVYCKLSEIADYYKMESYFAIEMIHYKEIESDKIEVERWISKNEFLESEKYICFLIDYLDYCEEPIDLFLHLGSFKEFNIRVERKYFINTIAFLQLFNSLYWIDKDDYYSA